MPLEKPFMPSVDILCHCMTLLFTLLLWLVLATEWHHFPMVLSLCFTCLTVVMTLSFACFIVFQRIIYNMRRKQQFQLENQEPDLESCDESDCQCEDDANNSQTDEECSVCDDNCLEEAGQVYYCHGAGGDWQEGRPAVVIHLEESESVPIPPLVNKLRPRNRRIKPSPSHSVSLFDRYFSLFLLTLSFISFALLLLLSSLQKQCNIEEAFARHRLRLQKLHPECFYPPTPPSSPKVGPVTAQIKRDFPEISKYCRAACENPQSVIFSGPENYDFCTQWLTSLGELSPAEEFAFVKAWRRRHRDQMAEEQSINHEQIEKEVKTRGLPPSVASLYIKEDENKVDISSESQSCLHIDTDDSVLQINTIKASSSRTPTALRTQLSASPKSFSFRGANIVDIEMFDTSNLDAMGKIDHRNLRHPLSRHLIAQ